MAAFAGIFHLHLFEAHLVSCQRMAILAFQRRAVLAKADRHPRRAAARIHVDVMREFEAAAFHRRCIQRRAYGPRRAETGEIGRAELRVFLAEIMRVGEGRVGQPRIERIVAIGAKGLARGLLPHRAFVFGMARYAAQRPFLAEALRDPPLQRIAG